MKKKDYIFELIPEIYKALSSTSYTSKTMKIENDVLMRNKIINILVSLVLETNLYILYHNTS